MRTTMPARADRHDRRNGDRRIGGWLIIFNGPPRTGKDHAARFIERQIETVGVCPVAISRIADVLKQHTHEKYGLTGMPPHLFEEVKDNPRPEFGGLTPREAYIRHFRDDLEPRWGESALGDLFARRLHEQSLANDQPGTVHLLPGAGYWPEVAPIAAMFDPDRILLLRIERDGLPGIPGSDYRGDLSELEEMGVWTENIHNDFTPRFEQKLLASVAAFLPPAAIDLLPAGEEALSLSP